MKIWISLFALFLTGAGVCGGIILDRKVLAEPQQKKSHRGDRMGWSITRFSEDLALSDEQKSRLNTALEESAREIEGYEREKHQRYTQAREKVLAILTEEQRKKLDDLVKKERSDRHTKAAQDRVSTYKTLLGLNDEQTEQLRAVMEESSAKKRDFFSDQQGRPDFARVKELMAQIRKEQDEKTQKFLTAEQFERYKLLESLGEWR